MAGRRRNDIKRALILIADSDPFDVRLLEQLCVDAGHIPLTAVDGDNLLAMMAREAADWVFVGADLAPVSGLDVLEALREDDIFRSVPVTLLTSPGVSEAFKASARALGAHTLLQKPLATRSLRHYLQTLPVAQGNLGSSDLQGAFPAPAPRHPGGRSALDETVRTKTGNTPSIIPTAQGGVLLQPGTAEQLAIALDYELTRAARFAGALGCIAVQLAPGPCCSTDALAEFVREQVRTLDYVFCTPKADLVVLLPETDGAGTAIVAGRLASRLGDSAHLAHAHRITFIAYPDAGTDDPARFLELARNANIQLTS